MRLLFKNIYDNGKVAYNRAKPLAGEFSIIVLGKVIALILTIIGIRMITDAVSPSVYGRFSIILTFATLGEVLFGVLGQGVGRYYFEAKNRGGYYALKSVFVFFSKRILMIITISLIPLYLYFQSWPVSICIPLYVLASGVTANISGIQNNERHRFIVTLHEILDKLFKYGGIILFSLLAALSEKEMMISYTLFMYVILLSQIYFYYVKIEKKRSKENIKASSISIAYYKKKVWKYITPFLLWTIFSWIQNSSDKWILEIKMSSREVGLYQVLNQYGFQMIGIGIGMLNALIIPILFEKAGNSQNKQDIISSIRLNNKIIRFLSIILFLAFIVTYSFHSYFFQYLTAAEYRGVSYLLPWMVLAGGFFAIGQLLSTNFMINYNPNKLLFTKISIPVIGLLLGWGSISIYGLEGLVAAVVLTQFIHTIWIFIISIKNKYV